MFGMNGWNKPNGDLISRAAALDAICRDGVRLERGGALMITISTAKQWAVDLLGDLPSAQPEQRWIPCSERLPEHGGWYITTYRITKDNNNRVGLLWYSTAHGWEWDNAIAWMPLPKPYREDDHDNT